MTDQHLWEKIKDKPYCDQSRRMDFVLLFDVKDGNPNGDPDAGNLPRMDPTTRHGIVTDVCIKRKVRDYLAGVLDRRIFIQNKTALNTLYYKAAKEVASYKGGEEPGVEEKQRVEEKAAVESLYVELDDTNHRFKVLVAAPADEEKQPPPAPGGEGKPDEALRSFRDWLTSIDVGLEFDPTCNTLSYLGEEKTKKGFQDLLQQEESGFEPYKSQIAELATLLADAKKKKKGGAQERAARDAVKRRMCKDYDDIRLFGAVLTAGTNAGQIRGPLQLTFARSIKPILPQDAAITRCAITKASDWNRKQTEFGRKPWLSYAAYRQHGFFNPLLGDGVHGTGVTRDDLARFWEALAGMFPNSASASNGQMATQDLIVFVHSNNRGDAPTHKLFARVKEAMGETGPQLDIAEKEQKEIKDHGIEPYRPLNDMWDGF